jgi:recombination protein RecA
VLDTGIDRKVVSKSGSYFSFGDERLGQGRQNATAFLREHPDVMQQILRGIQLELGPDVVVSARLLPLVEEAPENGGAGGNGGGTTKAAKAAAVAAAVAVGAGAGADAEAEAGAEE